ncbi:MAG: hypothetical protein EBT26_05400 [Microbacteriaceae bacterium]|nr:hypothetical protein [Microbacteriaceae bacterium]NBS61461.1 hypothetical protein [Microbacteriaceae bacterium]
MKPWLSKAAAQLREQIDDAYPSRLRGSDGWIADLRHQQAGKSDHIPDPKSGNVVRAIDIDARLSDDKGASIYLANQLRLYAKDFGRVSYVIHRGQIASPIFNYKWRKYRGYSPHEHHIHISFRKNQDNNSEFFNIPLLGGKNE